MDFAELLRPGRFASSRYSLDGEEVFEILAEEDATFIPLSFSQEGKQGEQVFAAGVNREGNLFLRRPPILGIHGGRLSVQASKIFSLLVEV